MSDGHQFFDGQTQAINFGEDHSVRVLRVGVGLLIRRWRGLQHLDGHAQARQRVANFMRDTRGEFPGRGEAFGFEQIGLRSAQTFDHAAKRAREFDYGAAVVGESFRRDEVVCERRRTPVCSSS